MAIKDWVKFPFTQKKKSVVNQQQQKPYVNYAWVKDGIEAIFNQAESQATAKAHAKNGWFGLQNPGIGIGGAKDVTSGNFMVQPPFLDFNFMDTLYRTNIFARKIINIPAEDMTRKWREFKGDADKVEARWKAELRYKVKDHIKDAVRYADLYGGAGILLVVDDGLSLDKPLKVKNIKKGSLKKLQPVFLGEMYPTKLIELDPTSPYFRKPMYYNINNVESNVHQSRLILFDGVELPLYAALAQLGFGDSRLTAPLEILQAAQMVYINIANLVARANIDVVGIKDFAFLAASDPQALFTRLDLQSQILGNLKQTIIDSEDSFNRHELTNITGLVDILMSYLQMIASAAEIPLTKFLGTSVAGFGTGENEIIEYYDNIHARQNEIDPQLRILDEVMERNTFGNKLELEYEWITLHQPAPSQKSAMDGQDMDTLVKGIDAGILTPRIAAEYLRKQGKYDGITEEYVNSLSNEVTTPEEDQEYEDLMKELQGGNTPDDKPTPEKPKAANKGKKDLKAT